MNQANANVERLYETLKVNLRSISGMSETDADSLLEEYGDALTRMVSGVMDSMRDEDGFPISSVQRHLRRMLCEAISGGKAYRDDGEASDCSVQPHIDYMRFSPQQIEECLHQRASNRLKTAQDQTVEAAGSAFDLDSSLKMWRLALNEAVRTSKTPEEAEVWMKQVRLFDTIKPIITGV